MPLSPPSIQRPARFTTSTPGVIDRNARQSSFSPVSGFSPVPAHVRSGSSLQRNISSSTFAPQFIKSDELLRREDKISSIEGENDFSGKRYVWVKDVEKAFVKGWVVEELGQDKVMVQFESGHQEEYHLDDIEKVNPAKFDKADDMAELTHLNEASVIHNLHTRYQSDLIYTYSGLFLVTINPYCPLPIYGNDYVRMYKGQTREDTRPHIFAVSDAAFRRLVEEGENQSILVTGESGAGKTENTKKVIQYLAAVATADLDTPVTGRSASKPVSNLSQQILRANPILEAFGNAQTVRNNNSSRFGKFIRIQFTRSGQVAGAFIDWYLLEKSRVVTISQQERSYHVFYQLLAGADKQLRDALLLGNMDIEHFHYLRSGNDTIGGVSDRDEWNSLLEAFHIMGFSQAEQVSIFRTIAAVLHLGNVSARQESRAADQATLTPESKASLDKACRLLGVQTEPFVKGLLHPRVKAGREWVEKVQTPEQVRLALDALAKGIYERGFGDLVDKINKRLDRGGLASDDNHFIGVLDIAGFEIFQQNSFEQLCINYTNEKLQQFFNHYMFVLEQEEYAREQIEWQFIDFGKDLQPTIDLIELPNPIGIFSCLDEDSVMPKATDASFTDKLHSLWEKKTAKYASARPRQGFILTHYAAEVEYTTDGWLEKNKDPLNDNLTRLLAASADEHVSHLFADCVDESDELYSPRSRVKKGLFRTVAQRHKEQLSSLMRQLHATQPHFVRCILPNHKKKAKQFNAPLVLDQLRCNGVLEGIRIARTGFPNRLSFAEFRSRYEVLCQNLPKGYLGGQDAARIILDRLKLNPADFRIGITKVFFRAGVLADLEEQRDSLIREIMSRFQSIARGFMQRRIAYKQLYRTEATQVIQRNLHVYLDLQSNPWWRLFVRMRPLLGATRTASEVKKRDERIEQLQARVKEDQHERQRIEEDRRRAELEISRVQSTLESERALALDKEEIFKRLQQRESELSEKLAASLHEQDTLEDQLDAAIDSKRQTEGELVTRREQVIQASQIIQRLEADKQDLRQQISKLEQDVVSAERETSKYENLDQEIRSLRSQVGVKERKIHELESTSSQEAREKDLRISTLEAELRNVKSSLGQRDRRTAELERKVEQFHQQARTDHERLQNEHETQIRLLSSQSSTKDRKLDELADAVLKREKRIQELEARLLASNKDLTSSRSRLADLETSKGDLQAQVDTLASTRQHSETQLRQRDAEIQQLSNKLHSSDKQLETLRKHNRELQGRHDSLAQERGDVENQMLGLQRQRSDMEKEAAEIHRMVQSIGGFMGRHFGQPANR